MLFIGETGIELIIITVEEYCWHVGMTFVPFVGVIWRRTIMKSWCVSFALTTLKNLL
jgi:hypothetical protein